MSETSIKNHLYKMKSDIGMANYEKQVKQELIYPIPISLCLYVSSMKSLHSTASCYAPNTKQRYRMGYINSCFTCFIFLYHPYIPYFLIQRIFHFLVYIGLKFVVL